MMTQIGCPCSQERCSTVVEFINSITEIRPEIAVVCGSGLGSLADMLENKKTIRYADIPTFPTSTVPGHLGNLVFGRLAGKEVVVMQGRFHWYECMDQEKIVLPIRVMKMLGVKNIILTNSAGGLNRELKRGNLVLIKDHISLPGLSLVNPLVGPNDERLGPRFVAMNNVYDSKLRLTVMEIASEMGLRESIREGVYVQVGGPTYESPAECRMLHAFGADVVGMSTVPEAMVARHDGMKVVAFSMVSNVSVFETDSEDGPNHNEVLDTAENCAYTLQLLIAELIKRI